MEDQEPSEKKDNQLERLIFESHLEGVVKEKVIIRLEEELLATKKELQLTATKLTQANRIITANFDAKKSAALLLDTGDDLRFGENNQLIIEKHPCGLVQFTVTQTEKLSHLERVLKEKEIESKRNRNLIFLLQKFMKELRTVNKEELIRNLSKDEINLYLKEMGWDAELEASATMSIADETEWYLVKKENNRSNKDKQDKISSSKKRSRRFTVNDVVAM